MDVVIVIRVIYSFEQPLDLPHSPPMHGQEKHHPRQWPLTEFIGDRLKPSARFAFEGAGVFDIGVVQPPLSLETRNIVNEVFAFLGFGPAEC